MIKKAIFFVVLIFCFSTHAAQEKSKEIIKPVILETDTFVLVNLGPGKMPLKIGNITASTTVQQIKELIKEKTGLSVESQAIYGLSKEGLLKTRQRRSSELHNVSPLMSKITALSANQLELMVKPEKRASK